MNGSVGKRLAGASPGVLEERHNVRRQFKIFAFVILTALGTARADDGRGLARSGNPNEVSISGVSSGAAMAIQYAVAHSSSIVGVGAVAGPGWGCADGRLSVAINDCMCGRQPTAPHVAGARAQAASGSIDQLVAGKPVALQRSYVFQSPEDHTVVKQSGQASIDFLAAFIGKAPVVDRGNAADGSNRAGHGIISPDGTDACQSNGKEKTYVRRCGAEDNAGKLFHALYEPATVYDPTRRVRDIPATEVWAFKQQPLIDPIKKSDGKIAPDGIFWLPFSTARRKNFDMADTGYLYVPPSCRSSGSRCRIHIALHGCKQTAKEFAVTAGYNNWADYYKVIVIYPALDHQTSMDGEVCAMPAALRIADSSWVKPNPNACWDWWGYLDDETPQARRYLTSKAPQMRVIESIIGEATR